MVPCHVQKSVKQPSRDRSQHNSRQIKAILGQGSEIKKKPDQVRSESEEEQFKRALKAPSEWRRAGHSEDAIKRHRIRTGTNMSRYQVENPHRALSPEDYIARARSSSLNPVIYPDWWGCGEDENAFQDVRRKRKIKVSPAKARVNPNLSRYVEDSLDARLRKVAAKHKKEDLNCNNYQTMQSSPGKCYPCEPCDPCDYPRSKRAAPAPPSHNAYMYNMKKSSVSPIRSHVAGASNVPMTFNCAPDHFDNRHRRQ